jgi:hypothetical protein
VNGEKLIRYCINGKQVCKDYFRRSSGFKDQLFNEIVAIVKGKKVVKGKKQKS